MTFSNHFTVDDVAARRANSLSMSCTVAAYGNSDMFKSPVDGKPFAKRWDRKLTDSLHTHRGAKLKKNDERIDRLNEESTSRMPSSLKAAARFLDTPGLISLGSGLPSSEFFPFEQLDINVPAAGAFHSEDGTQVSRSIPRAGKHDIADGKSVYDLHVALNYGQATGSAQMIRFVTEHVEIVHHPPYRDWQCTLTIGNTAALYIALRMFTTRGECIMTEEYTYPALVETGVPLGIRCIGIQMDKEGLIPSEMDSLLSLWDPQVRHAPKPWVLYTVPTGQNPTGATQSEQRRRDIYSVAQKHDVYILEDDPYYFLQMKPYGAAPSTTPSESSSSSSYEAFLRSLVPSFLSMDVDGRVMRMDSFSKVIAPGTRTGWITASEQIIERCVRHIETAMQNPSGFSQIILFKLLDETWGHAGYLEWLLHLRAEYTKRRDNICRACERFLPAGLTSWIAPRAGMFHWIKINPRFYHSSLLTPDLHPHINNPKPTPSSLSSLEDSIFKSAIAHGVLVCKGSWFRPYVKPPIPNPESENGTSLSPRVGDDPEDATLFFRMTFAAAPEDEVYEAVRRFGSALEEVFGNAAGMG